MQFFSADRGINDCQFRNNSCFVAFLHKTGYRITAILYFMNIQRKQGGADMAMQIEIPFFPVRESNALGVRSPAKSVLQQEVITAEVLRAAKNIKLLPERFRTVFCGKFLCPGKKMLELYIFHNLKNTPYECFCNLAISGRPLFICFAIL